MGLPPRAPLNENSAPAPASLRPLLAWLFVAVLTTSLLLFSGTVRSADGGTMLAVTRSLATRGSWEVPPGSVGRPGRDGRLYAQYGPACSVAALPLFLAGHGLARAAQLSPERTAQVEEFAVALFNPLVVALITVLVCLAAAELGVVPRWAAAGGLLCAFGTGLFVQMKDFNSEPLTALLFLGAFYVLLRQRKSVTTGGMAWAGALAGAAILARPSNALGAVILGVAILVLAVRQGDGLRAAGRVACFALPVLAGVGLYGWYNYARFGNPFDTGYHEVTFDYPLLRGLWLQLFSLERGLVWYNPLVLLVPIGALLLWRRGEKAAVALAAAMAAGFVLLYSAYAQAPAGGHSMGQRFLLVVVPLLIVMAVPAVERAGRGGRGATGETPVVPGRARAGSASSAPPLLQGEGVGGEAPRVRGPWTRVLVVAIIAVSVLVQLPLVWVNPSYYYAGVNAEREQAAPGTAPGADQAALVRSWALAAEVTSDALTRPEWVRSLPERAGPIATAAELLPGPRSFHVPYFWWALAWAYGVPGMAIWAAMLGNLALALICARGLSRSWPAVKETAS